jgi:putative acyl-CoA dehydrogenase
MSITAPRSDATHEVFNQVPPLENRNLFLDNAPLVEALKREGGGWAHDRAAEAGAFWGGEAQEWGRLANEHPPVLKTHDAVGNRVDEVEFHPAWHQLMAAGKRWDMHGLPWNEPQPGAHVARAAIYMSGMQAEAGFCCPITMTFAAVPALGDSEWVPRLLSKEYDGSLRPDKAGATCGMAMTEKQGGSDVRANTTVAVPLDVDGEYLLTGHKWFCSAPMCDVFLTLAQTEEDPTRPTCFVLPRFLPDGTKNSGFQLQRLKDKLGNKSNASAEVEYRGAWAQRLGDPGRGVPTIIEMVNHTRLDCVIGTAAGMRAAVAHATWHTAHRSAFGKLLADQPLMRNVLADLAIEAEAATALAMRLARAYDDPSQDEFRRVATAVSKYFVCKRAPNHAYEALETHGGNGYIEDSGMPRIYREAPLSSIWEGSGNVMALDVLRALLRTPAALEAFFAELSESAGADARLDAFVSSVRDQFTDGETLEVRARRVVESLALALEGSLLVRYAPAAVADAFCASRLGGDHGLEYGTLPAGTDFSAIVERHTPRL